MIGWWNKTMEADLLRKVEDLRWEKSAIEAELIEKSNRTALTQILWNVFLG